MHDKTKKLLRLFKKRNCGPARSVYAGDGTVRLRWYVSNDDDCYVDVVDSVKAENFLVVARTPEIAWAAIVVKPADVVSVVLKYLEAWHHATSGSPTVEKGTPNTPGGEPSRKLPEAP